MNGGGGKEEVVNAKKIVAMVNICSIGATFERGSEKYPSPGKESCLYLGKIKVVLSCTLRSINLRASSAYEHI